MPRYTLPLAPGAIAGRQLRTRDHAPYRLVAEVTTHAWAAALCAGGEGVLDPGAGAAVDVHGRFR